MKNDFKMWLIVLWFCFVVEKCSEVYIECIRVYDNYCRKVFRNKTKQSFRSKNKIISESQLGFKYVILALTTKMYSALDTGKPTLCVFMDFSKAFDT